MFSRIALWLILFYFIPSNNLFGSVLERINVKKTSTNRILSNNSTGTEAVDFKKSNAYIDEELLFPNLISTTIKESEEPIFHLFTHGKPGYLLINNQWLDQIEITDWFKINSLLQNKTHLNIYGCNFAKGEKGRAAVEYLEAVLDISIAASDDITGIDGDWELEVGNPKQAISVKEYNYNLDASSTWDNFANWFASFFEQKETLEEDCEAEVEVEVEVEALSHSFLALVATCSGNADAVISQTGVTNPTEAIGAADGTAALLYETNDQIILDLTDELNSGVDYVIRWKRGATTSSNPSISVEESSNGITWFAATGSPFTFSTQSYFDQTITASTPTRYLRLTSNNVYDTDLDAITYTSVACAEVSCLLNITTTYSDNCSGDDTNGYTADWKIGIEVSTAPDNAISYQRNSETIQTHTLTGTTDTLTIAGIPADGGVSDTLKVWFTNETTCTDTVIIKRPVPCLTGLGSNPGGICFNPGTPVTLLSENFDGLTGITPPTGWTQSTIVGSASDVWHFDNPGSQTFTAPLSAPVAIFDSDNYSSPNGNPEEAELVSPVFDASGWTTVTMSWDQYFRSDGSDEIIVEAYNGSTWQSVYSTTSDTPNPDAQSIDISSHVAGISNAQIRFYYKGDFSWYWMVDNVLVSGIPVPSSNITNTEIKGSVWDDYNYNGALDETVIIGTQGIQVLLTDDCGSSVATTYTDANGNYQFTGLTTGTTYRVEFNLPESVSCWAKPTQAGTDNRTTVQFVEPGSCASLGIASPEEYCQTNPKLLTSCYDTGPSSGGTNSGNPSIISVEYIFANKMTEAIVSETGSVWGIAYQRKAERAYMGTFLKRNVGIGQGLGHIHLQDVAGGAYEGSFDIQGVNGIEMGSVDRSSGSDYTLSNSGFSVDLDAFGKVGKVGFGDLDIIGDSILTAVNLNSRSLIHVDIKDPALLPTDGSTVAANLVTEYPLTFPDACTNGIMRPFGLKYYRGKGYLGVVCDASISDDVLDLHAYVYQFDPGNVNGGLTKIFDFPLNYNRELKGSFPASSLTNYSEWESWKDNWDDVTKNAQDARRIDGATPILSDIEFTEDGSMILGLMDRYSHQFGSDEPIPVATPHTITPNLVRYFSGGDILKACKIGDAYVMEGGAAGCPVNDIGSSITANEFDDGPSGMGEFFYDDNRPWGYQSGHFEVTLGAVALLPGNSEVIGTVYDAISLNEPGGLIRFNTINGATKQRFTVIPQGATDFDKAAGLGDLELLCDSAPLEIGNYVWEDKDNDGIQDACEPGISAVTVELVKDGSVIASTQTDANGQYYFSDKNATDANLNWTGTGIDTILIANTTYTIRISNAEGGSQQTSLSNLSLTTTDANSNNSNEIDNDASIVSTTSAEITATTGDYGDVDHSFDFGFSPPYSLGNQVFTDTDNSGHLNGAETGIDGVQLQLLNGADGSVYDSDPNTAGIQALTVTTANGGYYRFDDLPAGDYIVEVVASNFTATNALDNFLSSTGTNQEADPDSDGDINDNGLDTQVNGATRSGIVTLGTPEPTGEAEPGSYDVGSTTGTASEDTESNLTVDFGFYPCPTLLLAGTKNPDTCGGTEGEIQLGGLAANTMYTLNFMKDAVAQTAQTVTTDASGNYVITGLDAAAYTAINVTAAGCTSNSVAATLNDPSSITLALGTTANPTTCSGNDGTIQITGLAANTAYVLNFMKDGVAQTAQNITSDASGNFAMTGLDAAAYTAINVTATGCTSNDLAATLNDPSTVTLVLGTTANPTTCSGTDGTIQITGMTASTAYVLNFMKDGVAQTAQNINSDASGNYVIAGLDAAAYTAINVTAAGCTSNSVMATLNTPSSPTLMATLNNPTTCGGSDGTIVLSLTNVPDGVYTINYMDAIPTSQTFTNVTITGGMGTILGLSAGTFNDLSITINGCSSTQNVDVSLTEDCYSLGNQVFQDDDNSGDLNGVEAGIDGIQLQLLNSDGTVYDSDPNTTGTQALVVTTANGGYYRFDDLSADDYIVEVIASNFTSGNNLDGFNSSTGVNQEADPDSDGDINDNGLDTQVNGATRSGIVTLGTPEPSGETEPGSYAAGSTTGTAATDLFSNLTVDFGFMSINADYANPIAGFPPCPEQPCHIVNEDLKMGALISGDAPNAMATDDADGTVFPNNLRAGTSIRVRTAITNNTGLDAYLYAWVDWNNDDDFDDPGENFIAATYPTATFSGTFEVSNQVFIPSTTNTTDQIAMRFRLSSDQAATMSPCGSATCAADGEVEDYLIQLECPSTICLPLTIQINRE